MPDENKNIDLKRYETDVEGVSLNNLETGLWWSKHKEKIKKILTVLLIIVSIASWGYTLFGFGYYFLKGRQADEQLKQEALKTTVTNVQDLNTVKELSLSTVGVLNNGSTYDFYVLVNNSNSKQWSTFSYCFMVGDQKINCGEDFILPGDKKYITSLAQALDARPNESEVKFVVDSINWTKLDIHKIPNWETYKNEHLNISTKNEVFSPAAVSGLTEKVSLNTLDFFIKNNSAYGYFSVPLTITLFSGDKVVGVNRYEIGDFDSLDERQIKITWAGDISNVSKMSITPDLNILDASNYMRPAE